MIQHLLRKSKLSRVLSWSDIKWNINLNTELRSADIELIAKKVWIFSNEIYKQYD